MLIEKDIFKGFGLNRFLTKSEIILPSFGFPIFPTITFSLKITFHFKFDKDDSEILCIFCYENIMKF